MKPQHKNILMLGLVLVFAAFLFNVFDTGIGQKKPEELSYSAFQNQVEQKQIAGVVFKGDMIVGNRVNGQPFVTKIPSNVGIANDLALRGVQVQASNQDRDMPSFWEVLISWFPMLLLVGVWIFFYRQMQAGGGKAMGFGKSKAKLMDENKKVVTFADVAGAEEAKEEVKEVVDFLKDPQKFQRLGGRIPKGILLIGPPGTGKTLLARAIAGEAGVPFFSISGSDFVEMFVGVGASRVRDMFEQGKKSAPCIIFIDEIDAVGRQRGAGLGGGNDEREQTLNQLLVEMDGFSENEGVILIAATNRPDVLDQALLRPGRFDRQVVVGNPDVKGREEILEVHLQKVPQADDVNPRIIARGTPGFSGADLANIVNEAALMAARRGRRVVGMKELEEAKDKIMMGAERKSMVMNEEQKKLTAYHEGGHAIVGYYLKDSDPIHKATIVPRGRALGLVMRLPEDDRISMSRAKLEADIAVAMGGRVAEEMIFGHEKVTTGASSDISMATEAARRMVTEWGMSDKLGPLKYTQPQNEGFWGGGSHNSMSDGTSQLIDQEIRHFVDQGYKTAQRILKKHLDQLHLLANKLLEYETLSGDEIKTMLETGEFTRPDEPVKTQRRRSSIQPSGPSAVRPPLKPTPQPGV